MRVLDTVISLLAVAIFAILSFLVIDEVQVKPIEKESTEVVIEQACVNGYEWVVLVNAQGQSVALEQVYKASEVPGACAQPVECQDL